MGDTNRIGAYRRPERDGAHLAALPRYHGQAATTHAARRLRCDRRTIRGRE